MINGYKILRLKLKKHRSPEAAAYHENCQQDILDTFKSATPIKKQLRDKNISKEEARKLQAELDAINTLLAKKKKEYGAYLKKETLSRTDHPSLLIHRLVAEYFLPEKSENHTVVAHLDFDKLNNKVTNLKWMTHEENVAHQQLSPAVIAEKIKVKQTNIYGTRTGKLTVTKVMFLKKLLNEGVPIRSLAKQFKVTETQIIRIKNNINWSSVEAAK